MKFHNWNELTRRTTTSKIPPSWIEAIASSPSWVGVITTSPLFMLGRILPSENCWTSSLLAEVNFSILAEGIASLSSNKLNLGIHELLLCTV